MQVYVGLIMLAASRYLVQIFMLLIGQHGLGQVFRYRPLLPIGWMSVQIVSQHRMKMTNIGANYS
jgi:hypothetical protein